MNNSKKKYSPDSVTSSDSSDSYDSYDSDKEKQKIPTAKRLREYIKQKQLERKKGTKKEKENYDE
jgi:hypothetical protein